MQSLKLIKINWAPKGIDSDGCGMEVDLELRLDGKVQTYGHAHEGLLCLINITFNHDCDLSKIDFDSEKGLRGDVV